VNTAVFSPLKNLPALPYFGSCLCPLEWQDSAPLLGSQARADLRF
jgi:hypothetical protein